MVRHLIFLWFTPLLALTACLETESAYTLNPNGSGKVTHSLKAYGIEKFFGDIVGDQDMQNAFTREAARRMIRGTQGIDIWTEVSYGLDENGVLYFTGTAYFPDLNKVKLSEAEDRDQFPPLPEPTLTRSDNNNLVLTIKQENEGSEASVTSQGAARTESEISARMDQQRREWDQAKLMFGALPDSLKMKLTIEVPGTIESNGTTNFQQITPNQLGLEITGTQMIAVLDRLIEDETTARAIAELGGADYPLNYAKPPIAVDSLNEQLFGTKGPIKATVIVEEEPLFNYAAEVARAKANISPDLEELQD